MNDIFGIQELSGIPLDLYGESLRQAIRAATDVQVYHYLRRWGIHSEKLDNDWVRDAFGSAGFTRDGYRAEYDLPPTVVAYRAAGPGSWIDRPSWTAQLQWARAFMDAGNSLRMGPDLKLKLRERPTCIYRAELRPDQILAVFGRDATELIVNPGSVTNAELIADGYSVTPTGRVVLALDGEPVTLTRSSVESPSQLC